MNINRFKEKYDSLALFYDKRWKGYLEATHKVAIDLLEPDQNDIILDASGGIGLLQFYQTVIVVPSNLVREKPSKSSLKVNLSSLRKRIATSSPSFSDSMASERQ